jgi:hypothetical protein
LTVIFNNADGTTLEKIASLNANDRSIATVTLTELETEEVIGGNLLLELDENGDGSLIRKGVVRNALQRFLVDC